MQCYCAVLSLLTTSGVAAAFLDCIGRSFLVAEKAAFDLSAPSCEEYLTSAIGCFNQAIQVNLFHFLVLNFFLCQ